MNSKKIARSAGVVSIATLASRILGYLRDMVIARFFGATGIADAFYISFRIPNLLRDLLGEGAFSSAFIPVFTEYLVKKGKKEAYQLFSACLGILLVILSSLVLLGVALAPVIVRLVAWGWWGNPQQLDLAIQLTRIMMPFLAFISLAALAMGVLNSLHTFFIPALAPTMLSVFEILAVLFVSTRIGVPIKALAWGVFFGGLFQFLFQLPHLVKNGFIPRLYFKLEPGLKQIGLLLVPVMVASGIRQINVFVDQICASFLETGSVTAIYYANRLYQLPLALFGISVVTVALPTMSRAINLNNIEDLKNTFSFSMRMIFLTLVPSSIGLMVLGKPIIRILFQRGAFSSQATDLTNLALVFYSLGICVFAGVRITVAAFYSLQDTKTPVKIGIMAMLLNIVLNIILMQFLRVGGLALATTLSAMFNMTVLLFILRRRLGNLGGQKILETLLKVLLASIVMGMSCWLVMNKIIFSSYFLQTFLAIIIGLIIFLIMALVLSIEEIKYFLTKCSPWQKQDISTDL